MQFNKMIEQCHEERKMKEWLKKISLKNRCENEYALFSVWCRINELEPTEENFKKYVKAENKSFDFYENKYIYETYFNYEFNYETIFIRDEDGKVIETSGKWHSIKK